MKLLDNGLSPVTAAKAYRLLRAIMNTAVDDGLIRRNPCRIKALAARTLPNAPC
jgi:Phage integrase SAM-like domain